MAAESQPGKLEPRVTYADGSTEVRLGDQVRTMFWYIIPTRGRVVYVPGVSPLHPKLEWGGMRWVGLKTSDGDVIGLWVEPGTGRLKRRVRLVARDASPMDEIQPDQKLDD